VALRVLAHLGHLELLVPQLVGDEFERNKGRIEASLAAVPVRRLMPMSGRGLIRADRFLRILQPKSSVRPRLAQ